MSYGDNSTVIDLSGPKSTLVVGTNGAGKSVAFTEALTFVLYGKPYRKITKGQLVNSINKKNTIVEIDFEIGPDSFKVIRGIKPDKFEIYRNETLINKESSNKLYQEMLENDILKMSFKSFSQIVILGTAQFIPFMQLSTPARREFIEDLLGLEVFSGMNAILKEKVSSNKSKIIDNKHSFEMVSQKIEALKNKQKAIDELKNKQDDAIREKISKANSEIEAIETRMVTIDAKIDKNNKTILDKDAVYSKHKKLSELRNTISSKLSLHKKDKVFFDEHDDCPTCRQHIDELFRQKIIDENDNSISKIESGLDKLDQELQSLNSRIEEIQNVLSNVQELTREKDNLITKKEVLSRAIVQLETEYNTESKDVDNIDKEEVSNLIREKTKLISDKETLQEEKSVLDVSAALLKDGGIKARIIHQYIPKINKLVNSYLEAFEFFANFHLDENFDEVIKSRHRDEYSYYSFSQGEKARIDISLMLTWRHLAKMRNSVDTNLLIMDEVFDGSINSEGVENFKNILTNEPTNYIVISHKKETHESAFERVFEVQKIRNFTELKEIDI